MKLPDLSIRHPITTYMFWAACVLLGAIAFMRLPVDLMPETEYPTITVRTDYRGVAPEEIENLISRPIERALSAAPGVEKLTSTSLEGTSTVRVNFEWGTDIDEAANEIRTRIDRLRGMLPPDIDPPYVYKYDISQFPILFLALSADMDPRELRRLADEDIRYRLERVPGVAAADIRGGLVRQIQVNLSLDKIKALDLSVNQVVSAIRAENANVPVGPVKEGNFEALLRSQGEFENVDQLRQMVVTTKNGVPVYVSDIAEVHDGHEDVRQVVRLDGRPAVRMFVRKQSGSNTVEVTDGVYAEIEKIQQDMPHVKIIPTTDTAKFIKRAVANVQDSATTGAILAVLILLIFLRSFTSTFIIGVTIPVAIISTFALMYYYGFTLNTMSFGGLALGVGMLVDNSIVVLENIFRHREAGKDKVEAARIGSEEVGLAISASTLTTIVVFAPLIFLTGMSGIMFKQLAYVVTFSLLCSLAVALTLTPVMCAKFLRVRPVAEHPKGFFQRFNRFGVQMLDALDGQYQGIIHWALAHRKTVIFASVLLFSGSLFLIQFIGYELMPETDEGEMRVSVELPAGMRVEVTDQLVLQMEQIVRREVPEVAVIMTESGGGGGFRESSMNQGEIRVTLVDKSKRTRSSQEIVNALRPKISRFPGVLTRVSASGGNFAMRFRQSQGGDRIGVEIRGHDLEISNQLALMIRDLMLTVPGLAEPTLSRREGTPEVHLKFDRDKASVLGLTVNQVADTLRTTVGGTRASMFRDRGEEYEILVRLKESDRSRLDQITQTPIYTPGGLTVPVANLVKMERTEGPLTIERTDQERIIRVSGTPAGRDIGGIMEELRSRVQQLSLPDDFYIYFGEEYEEQRKAFNELLFCFLIAVILVYMVMASQFESLRDPFVIMFSIPFAVIGVASVLFLTNTTFNIQGFIGCVMLAGIVVNNAIVLVDYTNLMRHKYQMPLFEAIEVSCRRRLRPILMTTLTTALGLIPMSLAIGEGSEVQAPMGRVVVGGLLTSTIITLVLVPVIYAIFEQRREKEQVDPLTP